MRLLPTYSKDIKDTLHVLAQRYRDKPTEKIEQQVLDILRIGILKVVHALSLTGNDSDDMIQVANISVLVNFRQYCDRGVDHDVASYLSCNLRTDIIDYLRRETGIIHIPRRLIGHVNIEVLSLEDMPSPSSDRDDNDTD